MISLLLIFSAITTYVVIQYSLTFFLKNHQFSGSNLVFDPKELHEIAKKGIGKEKDEMFQTIHQELLQRYPKHIWKERTWHWFNAGGWMGSLCFLHASMSEYVILFGSPSPTSGHSGRYPLEVFDYVVSGEYCNQYEGTTDLHVYKPGERSYLKPMQTCTFCVKDKVWVLEYGRGLLPIALPFQAISTFCSTLDFISLIRLQLVYAKYLLYELFINQKI